MAERMGPRPRPTGRWLAAAPLACWLLLPGRLGADEAAWVRSALREHPALDATDRLAAATAARATALKGLPPPMLRASISNIGIPAHETPWLSLMVEQELTPSALRKAQVSTQRAMADAERLQRWPVRAALGLAARQAHLALRDQRAKIELLRGHLRHAAILAGWVQRLAGSGRMGVGSALARLHADEAALRAELEALEARAPWLEAQARLLLGLAPSDPLPPVDLSPAASPTATAEETADPDGAQAMPAQAGANPPLEHPALRRLAAQEAVAALRQRAERAAGAPTLRPGFGVMSMPGMPFGVMFSLGLSAPNAPTQRASRAATGDAARLERQAATAQRAGGLRALQGKLAAAMAELDAARARHTALKERVLPLQQRAIAVMICF